MPAPPWDYRRVPRDLDEIQSDMVARFATAMVASYVVTPNQVLAGTCERFEWLAQDEAPATARVVFYVTGDEFADYPTDLVGLSRIVGSPYPDRMVSDLRDFGVISFVERSIVDSPCSSRGTRPCSDGRSPTDAASREQRISRV
jgi:hypothetical protein